MSELPQTKLIHLSTSVFFLILVLSCNSEKDILPFIYGTVNLKLECTSEFPGRLVKIQNSKLQLVKIQPYLKFLIQLV